MEPLKLVALVLFLLALTVAAGGSVITGWNVWLCSGLAVWVLDQIVGSKKDKSHD